MSEQLVSTVKVLLKHPIAFHPAIARISGSITAGLFLSQAIYWSERLDDERNGWFYKTGSDWTHEIVLTRHEQHGARLRLKKLGFIEEDLRGVPPKLHYRVNFDAITNALVQFAAFRQIDLTESDKLDCRKAEKQSAEKRQHVLPKTGKSYKEAVTTKEYARTTLNLLDEATASPDGDSEVSEQGKAKPATATLFQQCVDALSNYWKQHNPDLDFVFGAKAGSNLKQLLKENQSLTLDGFTGWLRNRSRSENVNHAQDPFKWIPKLKEYANAPLDQYGHPVGRRGTNSRKSVIDITAINHSAGHEKRPDGSLVF